MRFKRGSGLTPSEKVLADLCDRSFLSLWTYPNLFRTPGNELCDALVIFGDNVIIFSDKSCKFPNSGDNQLDWTRWYRRSIAKSAHQISRAEGWITNYPQRVFLDGRCTDQIPIPIPDANRLRVHRVCIAIGASERLLAENKKTGFTVSTEVDGGAQQFTIGRISEAKGWVHVFDEKTLPIILQELSTTRDFLEYLEMKENLLESGKFCYAESELDLLAYFLWNDRTFPIPEAERFKLDPGLWKIVESDERFLAGRKENEVSYFWDRLIQYLINLYMNEKLEVGNEMAVHEHEQVVRIMAAESRFGRRLLAKWILGRAEMARDGYVGSLFQSLQPDVLYVLLVGPGSDREGHEEYRTGRFDQLRARCLAGKAAQPDKRFIVGIAIDAKGAKGSSEDIILMDTEDWTEEAIQAAESLRQELGYFVEGKARKSKVDELEYPDL